ncbi:MAG TPA: hypothetical protein VGN52_03585 [Burkholderiales bacterium]
MKKSSLLRTVFFSFFAATGLCPGAAAWAQNAIAPGEYLGASGGGALMVSPAAGGAQKFTLEANGANGHTCGVDGEIRGRQARVPAEEGQPACVIDFKAKGDDFDVTGSDTCRFFCGARATIDGPYLKPAAGCRSAEIKKTRAQFKQAYDRKDYAGARTLLTPLLANCNKTMGDFEDSSIRNDLAVTLYHLNDLAACRQVLESMRELAGMDDQALADNYPPSDAETYRPLARAARTNLRLCKGSVK